MLTIVKNQRFALLATQAICEGSAFLRNLLIARILGVHEMGLAVTLALGFRLFEMVSEFGFERLLIQVEDQTLPAMRSIVNLLQLLKGSLLTVAMLLVATPLASGLSTELNPAYFSVVAFALLMRGASNFDFKEQQRHGRFIPALMVEGGGMLVSLLACAPLAILLNHHGAIAWSILIHAIGYCAISHLIASVPYALGFDKRLFARCYRFGLPIVLNSVLMFLALQGDRFIVAYYFSPADLARFSLAAQLTILPALIGARYLLAAELPGFARLHHSGKDISKKFLSILVQTSTIAIIGAIALALLGNILVEGLYGEGYELPESIFVFLAIAAAARLVRAVPTIALMVMERTDLLLAGNLTRLVALPIALWAASHGSSMMMLVGIGALAEVLSLTITLSMASRAKGSTPRTPTSESPGAIPCPQ